MPVPAHTFETPPVLDGKQIRRVGFLPWCEFIAGPRPRKGFEVFLCIPGTRGFRSSSAISKATDAAVS